MRRGQRDWITGLPEWTAGGLKIKAPTCYPLSGGVWPTSAMSHGHTYTCEGKIIVASVI